MEACNAHSDAQCNIHRRMQAEGSTIAVAVISMYDPLVSEPQMLSCSSRSDTAEGRDGEGGGKSVRRPHHSPLYSRSVKDVTCTKLSSDPEGQMEFWHFLFPSKKRKRNRKTGSQLNLFLLL